jgi:hypothetical protein
MISMSVRLFAIALLFAVPHVAVAPSPNATRKADLSRLLGGSTRHRNKRWTATGAAKGKLKAFAGNGRAG